MALRHLMELQTGYANQAMAGATPAVAFQSEDGEPLTRIGYFSVTGVSGEKPTHIRILNTSTLSWERQETVSVNPTAPGWVVWDLGDPFVPTVGVVYKLHVTYANPQNGAYRMISGSAGPADGFNFYGSPGYYCENPPPGGYANLTWDKLPGVTIGYEMTDPPDDPGGDDDPPTNGSVTARLAEWLSIDPEVNTRQGDLPFVTMTRVDEIKALLDTEIQTMITVLGTTGSSGTGSVMGRLAAILPVVAVVTEIAANVSQVLSNLGSGGGTDVHEKLDALVAEVSAKRAPQDVVGMDDTAWVAGTTVVGSGSYVHTAPADRFVLTITEYGTSRAYNEVGTVPYWLHRGFWAVIDGDRVGHYYPIAGHKHVLYEVGSRLPGVLLGLDPDLEWTLTPYNYVA